MADPLPGVVDHHRELIGEQTVGAANDVVPDILLQRLAVTPLYPISKDNRVGMGSDPDAAGGAPRSNTVTTGPGINPTPGSHAAGRRNVTACTGAGKGLFSAKQLFHRLLVMSQAPALILDLSVPLETVGLQGMEL